MAQQLPSNRKFGAFFVLVFALLALWQGWQGEMTRLMAWLTAAILTALVTLVRPEWLTPFNRAWMALGELLGRIIRPIVLGVLYGLLIVPVGLFMRLKGRDSMRRAWDQNVTYWQGRTDGTFTPDRFKNQF